MERISERRDDDLYDEELVPEYLGRTSSAQQETPWEKANIGIVMAALCSLVLSVTTLYFTKSHSVGWWCIASVWVMLFFLNMAILPKALQDKKKTLFCLKLIGVSIWAAIGTPIVVFATMPK